MDAIIKAVDEVGSQVALARELGVHPTLISQWVTGHLQVAARHCIAIERACGGRVTRHELRPDIFGPAPEQKPRRQRAA